MRVTSTNTGNKIILNNDYYKVPSEKINFSYYIYESKFSYHAYFKCIYILHIYFIQP